MNELSHEAPQLPVFTVEDLYHPDGSINMEASIAALELLSSFGDSSTEQDEYEAPQTHRSHNVEVDLPVESTNDKIHDREMNDSEKVSMALMAALFSTGEIEIQLDYIPQNELFMLDPWKEANYKEEATRYSALLKKFQPRLYEDVLVIVEKMTPPERDVNKLDCVVAIPVAGHQEGPNIYRTLEQFTNQDMPNEQFEIILNVNSPGSTGENTNLTEEQLNERVEETLSAIEQFKIDHPAVSVRYYTHSLMGSSPKIGRVRSDLWAAVNEDLQQRGRNEDIMVISADADIIHLNSSYLSGMVHEFKNTDADIVAAGLKWQMIPDLPYDAPANRVLRYQTFLDTIRDYRSGHIHTADANTGISLAMYLAAGGYDRGAKLGEMIGVVNRIKGLRNLGEPGRPQADNPVKKVVTRSKGSWLKSHSRRLVKAMALGHSPYDAWDQRVIEFGANDSIRSEEMASQMANDQAIQNIDTWVEDMTAPYIESVDPDDSDRLIAFAKKILKLT